MRPACPACAGWDSLDAFIPRFAGVWRLFICGCVSAAAILILLSGSALVSQSQPFRPPGGKLKDQPMLKFRVLALALAGVILVSNLRAAGFADVVLDYSPGTGFASGFTNASVSLGQPTSTANPFSPPFRNTQLVSLGAGGSLTVQFNTPILNDPSHSYGLDFNIFGNTGFVITNGNFSGGGITDGTLLGNNPGATRVWVSQDNLTYYLLNPSLTPTVDSLFPTDGIGNFSMPVNPALGQNDFAGQGLAGIRALYGGSAGGTGFDISWAEDAHGNSVSLDSINFVRIDVLSGKSEIDGLSAVPEPRGWAIGVAGAALLLLPARRKRARAPISQPTIRSAQLLQILFR
ncbi:MAG: hypothetical protein JWR69_4137 [Pedosphaera sp.]|nr:hypothetical protein [Pedosphaera sp.]